MLSLRSYLIDAGRILLFPVEMGEVWSMHNADTQCTVPGERRPKGREHSFLCLNFSRLAIKYEFISHY